MPDRGPDSRKVMDLLMKLEKSARRAGGAVHALIGNHESMNIQGDLRYVHGGEYRAFVNSGSKKRQQNYYAYTVDYLTKTLSEEELPVFDDAYRENWEKRYPLGYVEHRLAWAPEGDYGKWVLGHNTVVKINNLLFVHGGLSSKYAHLSLPELNQAIRNELKLGQTVPDDAIANDEKGPLWYRDLSDGEENCEVQLQLESVLARYQADRVVVAHTPIAGVVLPRYQGRVIVVDVGLARYYRGARAALIIEGETVSVLHEGHQLPLTTSVIDYLDAVEEIASPAPLFREFLDGKAQTLASAPLDCSVIPEPTNGSASQSAAQTSSDR